MKKKINRIIKKVEEIYKYNNNYKELIKCTPAKITLVEVKHSHDIELESIEYNYYDKLKITSTGIEFTEEGHDTKRILEYNGWYDFLSL